MKPIAGTRLGPYEISNIIGAGGMGEVYLAKDTRLARNVAVKILSAHLSTGLEARERFEREARTIAALNHPHICSIFDVGSQNGVDYIVMEYLEGETLATRLERGRLPLESALRAAIQITDALDKAHRQGVTHRDLKPGNIMLTKSGAKLLDFGLAKLAPITTQPPSSEQPTVKTESDLTAEGTILGTLQYMAPEQLEGQEADARTDIFAFGVVLYEMITGKKAFEGKSKASIIAAIINKQPQPASSIQTVAPPELDQVIAMCVAKDPNDRWQSAHDLMIQLQWLTQRSSAIRTTPSAGVEPNRRQRIMLALVLVFAVIAVLSLGMVVYERFRVAPSSAVRFPVLLPEGTTLLPIPVAPWPTVSPDGRYLTFNAISKGVPMLWLQALDAPVAQPLPGTENGIVPFWSADSRYIGFFADEKLKKISISGGVPQIVCDAPGTIVGASLAGSWNQDGTIIFGHVTNGSGDLFRVSAAGGMPAVLLESDKSRQEHLTFPYFLEDGRHFLYLARNPQPSQNTLYLSSLDSKEKKPIVTVNSQAAYSPTGHILFVQSGKLMAQPFDARKGQTSADAFPIVDQIANTGFGNAPFSVSQNGILAFREGTGGAATRLLWFDRNGKQVEAMDAPGFNTGPSLSPDELHVAMNRGVDGSDIWLVDLVRGTNSRLTFEGGSNPIWSPDGTTIVFAATRNGKQGIYRKAASGTGNEELLEENVVAAVDWSKDGRYIIFRRDNHGIDVWALPLFGNHKAFPVLETKFDENFARLSPDGRFLAYASDESGRNEIYVQNFPPSGGKWEVSKEGAVFPRWRSDGRELLYQTLDNKIVSVDVKTAASFEAGASRVLFQIPDQVVGPRIVVTPDAQRFLIPLPSNQSGRAPITVLLNWPAAVKK